MSEPLVVEVDVNDLKPMPPEPPDYLAILANMRHVLRGAQVAVQNQMIPEHKVEAVYSGCIDGLIQSLDKLIPFTENQVEVVLTAIKIQRSVLQR
jgi:hypothetical protein